MEENKTTQSTQVDMVKVVSDITEFGKGVLQLETPLRAASMDVTELHFDFRAITGKEYVSCMDMDPNANAFRLSNVQAHALFALAASKSTANVDQKDILDRMSMGDTIKALEITKIFFTACSRAGNSRIMSA